MDSLTRSGGEFTASVVKQGILADTIWLVQGEGSKTAASDAPVQLFNV